MKHQRSVDEATLRTIVQRIVAVSKPGQFHRGHLVEEIYMNLIGVGQAVDVIVVTPEEIERYKDRAALVIYPAVREGRVVYAA